MKKNIIIAGSDSEIAENLLKKILERGDQLTTISRRQSSKFNNKEHFYADLSNNKEVKEVCEKLEKYTFDVFIYFPGLFCPKLIIEENYDDIAKNINVNLTSAILLSIPILKNMRLGKGGIVIFIGSSSAYSGFKNTSVYCSSKHGLLGFSRSIANEYRESGIKVSCISPGSVDTSMSIPLHKNQNPSTFIDPNEISNLLEDLIYKTPKTMWQEEIILKRLSYQ